MKSYESKVLLLQAAVAQRLDAAYIAFIANRANALQTGKTANGFLNCERRMKHVSESDSYSVIRLATPRTVSFEAQAKA